MNISPTLRPLLRDLLGAEEEQAIDDQMIHLVSNALNEARYREAILGDAFEAAAFHSFELN